MKQLPDLHAAFPAAPEHYTANLQHTLDHLEELSVKKRYRISIVVIVLALVLAVGAALATTGFDVLKSLGYTDSQGQTHEPEALAPYVQTIDQTFTGAQTTLTLHDAICDGKTLSLAWTLTGEDADYPLYLYWKAVVNDGQVSFEGGHSTANEFYWANGNPINGSLSYTLNPALEAGDTARVALTFTILKPTGEVVVYEGISDTATQAETQHYMDALQADIDAGKFVLEAGEPVVQTATLAGESPADAMLRLNIAQRADHYEAALSIPVTGQTVSLLEGGKPMTIALDGYTITLLQAELSPLQLDVTAEYAFRTEAAMTAFWQEREAFFYTLLFDGTPNEYSNSSGLAGDPTVTGDGRYIIPVTYTFTHFQTDASTITLMPESWAGNTATTYPEEAFTLRIQ